MPKTILEKDEMELVERIAQICYAADEFGVGFSVEQEKELLRLGRELFFKIN